MRFNSLDFSECKRLKLFHSKYSFCRLLDSVARGGRTYYPPPPLNYGPYPRKFLKLHVHSSQLPSPSQVGQSLLRPLNTDHPDINTEVNTVSYFRPNTWCSRNFLDLSGSRPTKSRPELQSQNTSVSS